MVDYTSEGFIVPIERDGVKGYASVNAMLYPEEDGLDVSGNYFVYLLHPTLGSINFTIEPTGRQITRWKTSDGPMLVEKDILQEIADQIESRKKNFQYIKT